jgi:ligand-binding sensor protein
MSYARISTSCVKILLEDGYLLCEGDKAYIDEVTMMVLQENQDNGLTEEDLINKITSIGRMNLRRVTEAERMVQAVCSPTPEEEMRPSIWKRAAWFIESMTRGPRFY